VAEVEALVTELHGVLQLLRIERPPLGAANTLSIRQRSCTALSADQPAETEQLAQERLGGRHTDLDPGADIHHVAQQQPRGVGGIGQEQGSTDSDSSPSNLA
jgi:hypothetical protein